VKSEVCNTPCNLNHTETVIQTAAT